MTFDVTVTSNQGLRAADADTALGEGGGVVCGSVEAEDDGNAEAMQEVGIEWWAEAQAAVELGASAVGGGERARRVEEEDAGRDDGEDGADLVSAVVKNRSRKDIKHFGANFNVPFIVNELANNRL